MYEFRQRLSFYAIFSYSPRITSNSVEQLNVTLYHIRRCLFWLIVYYRVLTPRKQGGLGEMKIPMLADRTGEIAKAYGVYKEDSGVAFRFIR